MNLQPEASGSRLEVEMVELHRPSPMLTRATVLGVVFGLSLALFMSAGMFLLGDYYFRQQATTEEQGPKLSELRAADDGDLTTYGWIDRSKGQVRIPVARAMELLAEKADDARRVPSAPATP